MQSASNVTRKSPIITNALQSNEKNKIKFITHSRSESQSFMRRIAETAKYDQCPIALKI